MKLLNHDIYKHPTSTHWVVFLHGAGGSSKTWDRQLTDFKAQFNVLNMDLRDHGNSKKIIPEYPKYNLTIVTQDILNLLDHLGIDKASFISLSMGSFLMQSLALQRPQLIEKCILAGAVFAGTWQLRWFTRIALIFNQLFTYQQMYTIFSWILMPRKNHQLARRLYKIQAHKLSPEEYLKWVALYDDFFSTLDQFRNWKVSFRTLVIMGDQDYVFATGAKRFEKIQPKVTLKIIPNAGHICNIDQPEIFNTTAIEFFKEH